MYFRTEVDPSRTTLAGKFKTNDKVIFDCNNEPHDMGPATLTAELMQACINGIRAAGATTQYIFVEGTSWTGAHSWFVDFALAHSLTLALPDYET